MVLNPVRAGMVRDAGAWPWSSYNAMVGTAVAPLWLHTGWILSQFSPQRGWAIRQYIDFVRAGVGLPSLWEQLHRQIYLGGEAFLKRMQRLADKAGIGEIPRAQRRPLTKPLSHYRQQADAKRAMVDAYATGDYTMQQIAACFDVHYATVSRAVRRSEGQG
ncbi:MAG: hypothetical protein K2X64_11895 [Rhodocyclaceae bacterium]|nr:hypothetical protein [Rhodocyclaceae bacterium]